MLSRAFIITLLTTQFIFIEVGGGALRPYHFLEVFLLALMAPRIMGLWKSNIFRAVLALNAASIFCALFSPDPNAALTSYVLFALNSSIAIAIAGLLYFGEISIRHLLVMIRRVTIISAVFALMQFAAFRGGVVLGYSELQIRQISAGYAPSFFNEANTYAKFLVTPLLLFLPRILHKGLNRGDAFFYSLISLVFLLNFMRSALVGIAAAILFAGVWFMQAGSFSLFVKRVVGGVAFGTFLLFWAFNSGVTLAEYNLYKLETFFDLDAVQEDQSWQIRSKAMAIAWTETISDPYRIALGNGWGQVYAFVAGEMQQVGGADLINIFAYDGLLGVVVYVAMISLAVKAVMWRARRPMNFDERVVAEGVLFALIANVVVGLVSGVMLLASFWLLIGLGIAIEREVKRGRAVPKAVYSWL